MKSPVRTAGKLLSIPNFKTFLDEGWRAHTAKRRANAPTVISTFAGCGGSSLGYSMNGCRELLAVELNRHAAQTFRDNFPGVQIYEGDIKKLSVGECLERTNLKSGELDILDGSPPCQGFSVSGLRKLDDPRNSLFKEYARLLRGLQPKIFVMENVVGMMQPTMAQIFSDILATLKSCGYAVKAQICNAKYFGVAQNRTRIIIVGVRNDLGPIRHTLRPLYAFVSLRKALAGVQPVTLPKLPAWLSAAAEEIFSTIRPGKGLFECLPDDLRKKYFPQFGKTRSFRRHMCQRPKITGQSPIIVRNFGTVSSESWIHPTENRYPAIEEIAAISSFPASFKFTGNYRRSWGLIGNCVPPMFMRGISSQILEAYFPKFLK